MHLSGSPLFISVIEKTSFVDKVLQRDADEPILSERPVSVVLWIPVLPQRGTKCGDVKSQSGACCPAYLEAHSLRVTWQAACFRALNGQYSRLES